MAAAEQLKRIVVALCVVMAMAVGGVSLGGSPALAQTADSWTTSLHDNSRDGESADTVIPESEAPDLTKLWSFKTGGPIASQPAIVGGVAYVGSWDGYEWLIVPVVLVGLYFAVRNFMRARRRHRGGRTGSRRV